MKKIYSLYILIGWLQLTLKQYINVLVHARQKRLSPPRFVTFERGFLRPTTLTTLKFRVWYLITLPEGTFELSRHDENLFSKWFLTGLVDFGSE